ncbi:MAG: hypothetical protein KA403_07850, partial [Candidatus Omnitrophica bacterium]|nr:hypothetical protein [Candidatus Omnitrophota bacterium]
CSSSCQFNTGGCKNLEANVCGNRVLETGEKCEVGTLNGRNCASLGFSGGTLGCTNSCQYNLSGCN